MNDLQVFDFEQKSVRVVMREGEPWFVGKDVAEALGYANTKDAIVSHVDEDDKKLLQRSGFATIENHIPKEAFPVNFVQADIPNRGLTVINESGVYSLVFGSKLEKAKEFKHWVTHEVLPTIRKHGVYMTPQKIEEALTNPDFIIRLAQELKTEREKRTALEAQTEADRPKVLFADSVTASQTSILIGDLAKLIRQNGYNIGQNRLFQWLRDNGYLVRRRGDSYNMPTQRSMELGLFEVLERTHNNPDGSIRVTKTPKATGKGQVYFVNRFLAA